MPGPSGPPFRVGELQDRGALWALNASVAAGPVVRRLERDRPAGDVGARPGFDELGRADGRAVRRPRPATRSTLLRLAAQIEEARPWAQRAPAARRAGGRPRVTAHPDADDAARDRRARRARGGRGAARAARPRGAGRGRDEEHADRPRQRGRRRGRGARSAPCSQRERPGDAILGEEGDDDGRGDRAALGRRPARRHRQLPVRDPAVVASRSPARASPAWSSTRCATSASASSQDVLGDARRRAAARERARATSATALVATGFGYDAAVRRAQAAQVAELLPQVRDIRRLGSAALDLAWTAAGRYDAYYERGVQRVGRRRRA